MQKHKNEDKLAKITTEIYKTMHFIVKQSQNETNNKGRKIHDPKLNFLHV